MELYHGSHRHSLRTIKPLSELSETEVKSSISSDTYRESCRDIVFLTSDPSLARQYAGKDGAVYIVTADAVSYVDYVKNTGAIKKTSKKLLQKKIKKISNNNSVFVAKSAIVVGKI